MRTATQNSAALRSQMAALEAQNAALAEQLRQREAELAAAQEALRSAARGAHEVSVLKEAIVSNVSHEMRTPMLQVKSAVVSLRTEIELHAELAGLGRIADFAESAASRLADQIQNISQLAAAMSLRQEPFRLLDAVDAAVRQLARSWSAAKEVGRIRLEVSNSLPPVMGDRNGIAQVLHQLIDNGLKFSPDGSPVNVGAEEAEDGLWVTVRDWGIGIDESATANIFQAFFQVEHNATRRFGGTGVGLAIVKLILDGLEAPIEVRSEPGQGSMFAFRLPYAHLD